MRVYSWAYYDDYKVFFSLKSLYECYLTKEKRTSSIHINSHLLGRVHESNTVISDIYYTGSIFEQRKLTNEEFEEIVELVDKSIAKYEALVKEMVKNQKGFVSGWVGGTSPECREQEIARRALLRGAIPKTFEELDQNLFIYESRPA